MSAQQLWKDFVVLKRYDFEAEASDQFDGIWFVHPRSSHRLRQVLADLSSFTQ